MATQGETRKTTCNRGIIIMIINDHCRHRDHQGRSYSQVGTTNNVPCTITLATQELIPILPRRTSTKGPNLQMHVWLMFQKAVFGSSHQVVKLKLKNKGSRSTRPGLTAAIVCEGWDKEPKEIWELQLEYGKPWSTTQIIWCVLHGPAFWINESSRSASLANQFMEDQISGCPHKIRLNEIERTIWFIWHPQQDFENVNVWPCWVQIYLIHICSFYPTTQVIRLLSMVAFLSII